MKNYFLLIFCTFYLKNILSFAQVSGNPVKDFNENGISSSHKPRVSGINVKAFNAVNVLIYPKISANTVNYSLTIVGGTSI